MKITNELTEDANAIPLTRTGFKAVYWRLFFLCDPKVEEGQIKLPINKLFPNEDLINEVLFIDGERRIPLQTYFQYNFDLNICNEVYIFQSVTDALAYFQLKKMDEVPVVFLALGKSPSEKILQYVKTQFSGARFFLAYPNTLLAKVAEIKIIGYLKGEQIKIQLKDNLLLCKYRNREVSIASERLSLSEVQKLTGFWPKLRTLKPPKGYDSFYDLLRQRYAVK
ncbi:MAG: hypothetical protein M5Z89_05060 [Olivibacter sp.]|nr:hypothetical protein [Olivibacter sp. UJ_SKK_5.1]